MNIKKTLMYVALSLLDISFIFFGLFLGLFLRFDTIPLNHLEIYVGHIHIIIVYLTYLVLFGVYNSLWQYGTIKEILCVFFACFFGTLTSILIEIFLVWDKIPVSAVVISGFCVTLLIAGSRIVYRYIRRLKRRLVEYPDYKNFETHRTMILGAGNAASIIIREMAISKVKNIPVVVLDDDLNKHGKLIHGIKISGDLSKISYYVKKYQVTDIILAIPSLSKGRQKDILLTCSRTGCRLHIMPSVTACFSDLNEKVIRPVNMEDLLGRDEVDLDIEKINGYLEGKTVLITGGGGSIGSEIARQIVQFKIKKLLLIDINENGVYELLNELKIMHNCSIDVEILIGSIRDEERIKHIFEKYSPDIVYHAAAHKHVPLMEACPEEAIKNNVLGTLNLVNISNDFNVEKFILISTDKAVNPTSIMGATKRIAEQIIQAVNTRSKTKFSAVRFGNVLGSNGSVVPLFKKQIEAGGPITITHPEIVRYFMTISEAAKLVIQAGAISEGGEIFVLNMGEPVKIMDLARNMISLSGLIPDVDIKIKITGLRPGEKLFEELLYKSTQQKTIYDKIFVEEPDNISYEELIAQIVWLVAGIEKREDIRDIISRIIPMYKEDNVS